MLLKKRPYSFKKVNELYIKPRKPQYYCTLKKTKNNLFLTLSCIIRERNSISLKIIKKKTIGQLLYNSNSFIRTGPSGVNVLAKWTKDFLNTLIPKRKKIIRGKKKKEKGKISLTLVYQGPKKMRGSATYFLRKIRRNLILKSFVVKQDIPHNGTKVKKERRKRKKKKKNFLYKEQ